MSRDAKNSIFAAMFVCAFFGALYLASQLESGVIQIVIPLAIAIMFPLAKRYVLSADNDRECDR